MNNKKSFERFWHTALYTINYTSLGIQFSLNGSSWESTKTLDLSNGKIESGTTYTTSIYNINPAAPEFYRMVIN